MSARVFGPALATPTSVAGGAARGWPRLRRRLRANLIGLFGAAVVVALVLVAVFAEVISPHEPNAQIGKRFSPPGEVSALGLDQFGRDVLSRLIHGARVSLGVAVVAVGAALLLGGALGLVGGYVGGRVDTVISHAMNVLFTLPSFVLALALAGILGPSPTTVVIAVAAVTTPTIARVMRAPVLSIREQEYVTGARTVGARDLRIMLRHVLPNALAPVIVQTTASIADAIVIEAGLSFLGLGVQAPNTSWGNMLGTGRSFMELANGLSVFPGLAIMLAVLGFNFAGDGLRDLLDPRLRGN